MIARFLTHSVAAAVLALALLPSPCPADAIRLKSGEKLQGRFLSEDDSGVVFEVQVSGSIYETRTFTRADVEGVDRADPSAEAFRQLVRSGPGPHARPVIEYDRAIEGPFQTFLDTYPRSPFRAEAERLLGELKQEKERVMAGEWKMDGKWISAADFDRRRPEIEAEMLVRTIQQRVEAGDAAGALNAFDLLERQASGTPQFIPAIPLATKALQYYSDALERLAEEGRKQEADWEQRIASLPEGQKTELREARQRENAQYAAAFARSRTGGVKWPPNYSRHAEGIAETLKQIKTEQSRMAKLNPKNLQTALDRAAQAEEAILAEDYKRAASLLSEARKLWTNSVAVTRVQAVLTDRTTPQAKPSPAKTAVPTLAEAKAQATGQTNAVSPTPQATAKGTPKATPKATPKPKPIGSELTGKKDVDFYTTPLGMAFIGLAVAAGIGILVFILRGRAPPKQ